MPLDNLTYLPATGPAAGLARARALVEKEENWCSSGWGKDGKMCMVHAVHVATGGEGRTSPVYRAAWGFLQEVCGYCAGTVNDTHTHAECMAKMDEAIALACAAELEGVGR